MAYRRRQGLSKSSTFKEEILHHLPDATSSSSPFDSGSLAAPALHASSAARDTNSPVLSNVEPTRSKGFNAYEDSINDSKGFWGVLARKAKAILDDDNVSQDTETRGRVLDASTASQASHSKQQSAESYRRMDHPAIRRGLDRLNTSLNQIGDSFEKTFEEGRTIVEGKTQDIIHETRKLQIRRKGNSPMAQNQFTGFNSTVQPPMQLQNQTNHDNQLKASRDVAMATAAKAKLLLRELKTVKADLAFAKERCAQLEEENKLLRESREKGDNPADDDLIRLQLETLLAEKGRLAHENSIYARENRFLREIIEYHQLSMQDVVYLDEGAEEVAPVGSPINFPLSKMLSGDYTPELEVLDPSSSPSKPRIRSPSPSPSQPRIRSPSPSLSQPRIRSPSPNLSQPRIRSPSPCRQQPILTKEISSHLSQPAEEASKGTTPPHASNSKTNVPPTSTH
ncbi:hypothetical protein GOBAR_AA35294 [Gossypium barbadense]|uniref:Uncharacterized protein n=1 Tax=Gossypium barbadense TaxID=3634 RepID=A0A2P5RTI9_GOSBA|nr:hypothetical protein GOBAR_DD12889 [Gossypium barbadense]PPR85403.1 hypothetical protein GOBAR_AA35294 [Gossypium barbadense]